MAYRRRRKSTRRAARAGFSRSRSRVSRSSRVASRRRGGVRGRRSGNTLRIVIDQPRAATPAETMLQSLFKTPGPKATPNGSKF